LVTWRRRGIGDGTCHSLLERMCSTVNAPSAGKSSMHVYCDQVRDIEPTCKTILMGLPLMFSCNALEAKEFLDFVQPSRDLFQRPMLARCVVHELPFGALSLLAHVSRYSVVHCDDLVLIIWRRNVGRRSYVHCIMFRRLSRRLSADSAAISAPLLTTGFSYCIAKSHSQYCLVIAVSAVPEWTLKDGGEERRGRWAEVSVDTVERRSV